MSIKQALAAALESDTNGFDGEAGVQEKIEQLEVVSAPGTFKDYIENVEEGHTTAAKLLEIADKSDAIAESGEASLVSAESMMLAMETILNRYDISNESVGLESIIDPMETHRQIAEVARTTAFALRDALHVSQETMSLKAFFANLMNLEKKVVELKSLRDELKRNKEWYQDNATSISHFGVYQFLTKGNKLVTDISKALNDDVKTVNELFNYGEELGKQSDKVQDFLRKSELSNGEEVAAAIKYFDSLPSGGDNIRKINGTEMLGNRTVVVKPYETGLQGNQAIYYYAEIDQEQSKPTNKAAWWARLGAGIVGWMGGGQLGLAAGAAVAAIMIGPPVSVGTALAIVVMRALGTGYGIVKGVKTALKIADRTSSSIKTISSVAIDEILKSIDAAIEIGEKALKMRRHVTERSDELEVLSKMTKEKLEAAGVNKELKRTLSDSLFAVDNYHWAEWNCYDVAIEQASYNVENTIRLTSKLVEATKS